MSEPTPQARETKKPFMNWFQGNVLADRYLETILADWKGTGLLLLQAPLLAGLAVMVWGNLGRATSSLYFVMTLSMLWVGCMDSCREIVKERSLFLREKMAGLNLPAYLYSKVRVLGLLASVQAFAYGLIIHNYLDVKIPVGWLILNLMASTFCGVCLGLFISAMVKRSDYAVGLVPLVIIPQILFSEFAIAGDKFQGISELIYELMPSRWGYESFLEFADTGGSPLTASAQLLPLLAFSVLFVALSLPILKAQKY